MSVSVRGREMTDRHVCMYYSTGDNFWELLLAIQMSSRRMVDLGLEGDTSGYTPASALQPTAVVTSCCSRKGRAVLGWVEVTRSIPLL